MNNFNTKLVLSLFVLAYATICGLFIHSFLTGDAPPILILLFTILPIVNSNWQTTRPESNVVQKLSIFIINRCSGFSLQVLP